MTEEGVSENNPMYQAGVEGLKDEAKQHHMRPFLDYPVWVPDCVDSGWRELESCGHLPRGLFLVRHTPIWMAQVLRLEVAKCDYALQE